MRVQVPLVLRRLFPVQELSEVKDQHGGTNLHEHLLLLTSCWHLPPHWDSSHPAPFALGISETLRTPVPSRASPHCRGHEQRHKHGVKLQPRVPLTAVHAGMELGAARFLCVQTHSSQFQCSSWADLERDREARREEEEVLRGLPRTSTSHPTAETCLVPRMGWGAAAPSGLCNTWSILQGCSHTPVSHQPHSSGRVRGLCTNLSFLSLPVSVGTKAHENIHPCLLYPSIPPPCSSAAFPDLSPFLCASDEFPALAKPLKASDRTSPLASGFAVELGNGFGSGATRALDGVGGASAVLCLDT